MARFVEAPRFEAPESSQTMRTVVRLFRLCGRSVRTPQRWKRIYLSQASDKRRLGRTAGRNGKHSKPDKPRDGGPDRLVAVLVPSHELMCPFLHAYDVDATLHVSKNDLFVKVFSDNRTSHDQTHAECRCNDIFFRFSGRNCAIGPSENDPARRVLAGRVG